MKGTDIAWSVSATGVTHSPAKLTVENGSVGPVILQQVQSAIYVLDRTDHPVSGTPQLGVELQCDEVLVFDNQYSGSVVHNVVPGFQDSTGAVM